jgi:hypothetical protein
VPGLLASPRDKMERLKTGMLVMSQEEFVVAAGYSLKIAAPFKSLVIRHGFRCSRSTRSQELFGISLRPRHRPRLPPSSC